MSDIKKIKKNKFLNIIIILLILIKIKLYYCQKCKNVYTLDNPECFNNVLVIKSPFRAGQFAKNKEGDLIVEYSSGEKRLFFGLHKNGKYYYNNELHYKEKKIEGITKNGYSYNDRYESTNLFVTTENDINKSKEYLLSLSSYKTLIEIYDVENDLLFYSITENVFTNGIFSFKFPLLENIIDNKNIYYTIYTHDSSTNLYAEGNYFSIKKFSFEKTTEEEIITKFISSSTKSNIKSSRIISGFLGNDCIYVIFVNSKNSYPYKLYIRKYNYQTSDISSDYEIDSLYSFTFGSEIYKSLFLKNNYASLIYFKEQNKVIFCILNLNSGGVVMFGNKESDIDIYPSSVILYDFVKITDERLVFIVANNNKISLLFIDLYNNYNIIIFRLFSFSSSKYYFKKELSGFNYNDYLIFTITSAKEEDSEDFSPLLMIFGYPNGKDEEIDISPYLSDCDLYDQNNNIYSRLFENFVIDNNIFGYEKVEEIKLINIPDQIKIYNVQQNQELNNGDILDINNNLTQNSELIKNYTFYNLDYQFIVQEPICSIFYGNAHQTFDDSTSYSQYFTPKKFYGRTNTLKFRLCHRFCKTCKSYGTSDDDQKCLSCLPEYQYDYYNISKNNCVPEGYFYDTKINKLVKCDNDNFTFINDENTNKTFCIPYKEVITTIIKTEENLFFTTNLIQTTHLFPIETTMPIPSISTIIKTKENLFFTTNLIQTTHLFPIETTMPIPSISTNIVPTTLPIPKENISLYEKCNYIGFFNGKCNYLNYSNIEIYQKIIPEIIKTFPESNGSIIIIKGENNNIFQITTEENEKKLINNNKDDNFGLTVLDLKDCGEILKTKNDINPDHELIILKYEKISNNVREKNLQYEIYNPDNKMKLDLSVCNTIDLNIPISLRDEEKELYDDLKENGYDYFNINDKFYQDICTTYKSLYGTDILSADRQNDIYNPNFSCQDNCHYSSYSEKLEYLKCECEVNFTDIRFEEVKDVIYESFASVLKFSNYKFLYCYKLLFSLKTITKNYGSISLILLVIAQLTVLIIYIFKGIKPLKFEIIKINENILDRNKYSLIRKTINISKQKGIKKRRKTTKYSPPKKIIPVNFANIQTFLNRRSINKYNGSNNKINNINNNSNLISGTKKNVNESKTQDNLNIKRNNKSNNRIHKLNTDINPDIFSKDLNLLDDYELNQLDFQDALKLDKRTFIQIYCSMLRKKHLIMIAFCTPNDFNLSYIKFSKFIFSIGTNFAMNVLFFFDESIHKIYINSGGFNFIQQIPQIIYSFILSILIEYIISFLILSEKEIHKIKNAKKTKKDGYLIYVYKTLQCIKIKFIFYFIFSFTLLLFYWYFVSTFCAVYENTQVIFIKDVMTSFGLNLLYPLLTLLIFTIFRVVPLRCNKKIKTCELIYKLGVF